MSPRQPEGAALTAPTARSESTATPGAGWRPGSGWVMGAATAMLALTAPGQTAGVSTLIDPMIAELGVTRSLVSTAYLVGTLTGALALPLVGRALDWYGLRRVALVIVLVFGGVLVGLSTVTGLYGLTAGFVGIRMAGQGALSLAATTAVGLYITQRRGLALGIVTSVGGTGISLAPLALERLVAAAGWRTVWLLEGLTVWAVLIPVVLLALPGGRRKGAEIREHDQPGATGATLREAMRSPLFWIATSGVAAAGMLVTAVNFHQISLLGEHGLNSTEAAANFLPQTLAGIAASFGAGALVDRFSTRWLMAGSMALLAAGMWWTPLLAPGASAIVFGLLIGASSNGIRALEAATFPAYFGLAHLGAIRGFVHAVSVAATAFGPIALATVQQLTGSYTPALLGLSIIPAGIAAAALVTPYATAADRDLTVVEELVGYAREAFGWGEDVAVSAGPRGALGQIWRVDAGPARYALKEIFADPPSEALVEAELAFTRRAADAGVRLPASHPDREGRYLSAAPGGKWLRLYDWIDLRPLELTSPAIPGELGALFARLHRCAPATTVEPDGEPPDPWYDRVPAVHRWAEPSASGAPWAARLAERLTTLPELCAAVTPADPAELIVCHRDLHPENVLADPAGALVVVDWDNLGPAVPARELARALFDWFCDGPIPDLDGMRGMYDAYVREGGPARITEPADFSMLLASRLNFLLRQTRIATDPEAEQRHREWAVREIDEALQILPTPRQLAGVLELTRAY
ncbi:MAG: MFS transporter [Micromonosporaceae bacterium]